MNGKSLGVCFTGDGRYHPWTDEQREAGMKLVRHLMEQYNIPPARVLGHRECGGTVCPGQQVDMDVIRASLNNEAPDEYEAEKLPPDATPAFRHIVAMFDEPTFHELPIEAQKAIKELRWMEPFGELNREDLE
jgi:N-acetyl-anhydromuramyl-L-alanine amidase AmpD